MSVAFAKDITVVHSANGEYICYEKCSGPAETCPKVICPIEWEEEKETKAEPVQGQFPGMDMGMMGGFPGMGFPGMGFPGMGMGGFPGMGFPGMGMGGFPGMGYPGMGFPGMDGMGGYPGMEMNYQDQPAQANACGCVNTCQPCMWWYVITLKP